MVKDEIDPKLMRIYRHLCKMNDKIIAKEKNSFMPVCIVIKKDCQIVIGMRFCDGNEKEQMRQRILKLLAEQGTKAYILIMDAKMTTFNQKTNEKDVKDISMRTIYTPKKSYMEAAIYKDGKILETIKQEDGMTFKSEWNLWDSSGIDYDDPEEKKTLDEYDKFKKENKDLYGDLA